MGIQKILLARGGGHRILDGMCWILEGLHRILGCVGNLGITPSPLISMCAKKMWSLVGTDVLQTALSIHTGLLR